MTETMREDCRAVALDERIPWEDFDGKTCVVSGATGLIGKTLVGSLLERHRLEGSGPSVVALVRDERRAYDLFGTCDALSVVRWDASAPKKDGPSLPSVDYLFHGASITSSASFVRQPVEVIDTALDGTRALLSLAKESRAAFVLLSTMETYGEVGFDSALKEDEGGFLDTMVPRNSYPEAKRLCEALCAGFASEYGVKAYVARLAQTFGPGVLPDDQRVFAYFARCARACEDIVMLTEGTKRNPYLYTADAARALLLIAAKGEAGHAYNVANEETFCEVRAMARMVADRIAEGRIALIYRRDEAAARMFRKGSVLRLDTSRLRELGWKPRVGLEEMYRRMIADWDELDAMS